MYNKCCKIRLYSINFFFLYLLPLLVGFGSSLGFPSNSCEDTTDNLRASSSTTKFFGHSINHGLKTRKSLVLNINYKAKNMQGSIAMLAQEFKNDGWTCNGIALQVCNSVRNGEYLNFPISHLQYLNFVNIFGCPLNYYVR